MINNLLVLISLALLNIAPSHACDNTKLSTNDGLVSPRYLEATITEDQYQKFLSIKQTHPLTHPAFTEGSKELKLPLYEITLKGSNYPGI